MHVFCTAMSFTITRSIISCLCSEQAIKEALELLDIQEHITIQDLLNICGREKLVKPPWILDEEDKSFTGYNNLSEMLEDMDVDVKKVCILQ